MDLPIHHHGRTHTATTQEQIVVSLRQSPEAGFLPFSPKNNAACGYTGETAFTGRLAIREDGEQYDLMRLQPAKRGGLFRSSFIGFI